MKASNLVFTTSIIEKVKHNWLTIKYQEATPKTDSELVIYFVKLSIEHDTETDLADEIANIVMHQSLLRSIKTLQS